MSETPDIAIFTIYNVFAISAVQHYVFLHSASSNVRTPSPFDDSDSDPNYDPYMELNPKRRKIFEYRNDNEVFPNFESWETAGSNSRSQELFLTSNSNKNDHTAKDNSKVYFELQNVKLSSDKFTQKSNDKKDDYNNTEEMSTFVIQPFESPAANIPVIDTNYNITNPENLYLTTNASEIKDNLIRQNQNKEKDGLEINESIQTNNVTIEKVPENTRKADDAECDKIKRVKKLSRRQKNSTTSLLPICKTTCRQKCFERLNEVDRKTIFCYFNKLSFGEKRLFLSKYVFKKPVKYRKADAETNKQFSLTYNLPSLKSNVDATKLANTDIYVPVCKTMFLHTIGYKSDSIITEYLKNTEDLPRLEDKRGQNTKLRMNEIAIKNYEIIKEHINSYHPQQSHYNLSHSPHRRYLTADLTIRSMHSDFNSKHANVAYETYRRVFEKENIGFSAPSQDDCGNCSSFKNHVCSNPENPENKNIQNNPADLSLEQTNIENTETDTPTGCEACMQYKKHRERYRIAREEYTKDSKQEFHENTDIYAVDMQKVIIIPKMTIKNSFFVSRLVVFHETFANLKQGGENMCVIWHEAIMGRNSPDVTSAYYNMIKRLQDTTQHVIFWADNCTSQNKNWILFTACITFVNEEWGPETITFKYFEPGHSFMKADSIHGQIGKKWKQATEILDFEDLENLIRSSNKKNHIVSLRPEDFRKFENGCLLRKKDSSTPKLQEIKQVQFRKGCRKLFFKRELEEDDYNEVSILKPKFKIGLPDPVTSCRYVRLYRCQNFFKYSFKYFCL